MPPASHQIFATPLKLLIQQTHPHVRVERDPGMCVARDLYELSLLGENLFFVSKVPFFAIFRQQQSAIFRRILLREKK